MTRTVLISGGGIAGSALATQLHRNGFTPTVVERAPALRTGGYKVDLRGAAVTVIERMGLLDQVRAVPTEVRRGTIVTADGRPMASMSGDTFGGRTHLDAELLRGDLNRLLASAAPVEYRYGESIESLVDGSDGVEVGFASGATGRYDLVVGADGLHSRVRKLVFGPGFVRDLGYRVGVAAVPNHLGLDREEVTYVAPGRTALVYSTAREAGARAMFLFRSGDEVAEPRTRADQERLLTDAYAGQGWEVPRLLAALPGSADLYLDRLSQVHMGQWSRGRVALVGDAAWCASPASGQGTSLAVVGAYVLAGELAAAGADHRAGLAAAEHVLRPFVARNQALGPANIKRMVLASRGQVRISLAMLRLLNRLPGKDRLMAKAIEPIHRAATAIALPTY